MKKFLLSVLISISSFLVSAQGIDSMMKVYADNYPQQKIYVQFDKGIYSPGETIWFKAYIFAGFEPSNNSKNFYAELTDDDGNVLQKVVYPVIESSAAGSFVLPAKLDRNIRFRAYSRWMLNFDNSFLFQKEILISSKGVKTKITDSVVRETSVQFFPEGGDLVNTLESVVAFKASDKKGLPVSVNGSVNDSKGNTVAQFSSRHNGMGTFILKPLANETYTASWKDEFGKQDTATLPKALETGVVLKVQSVKDKKLFIIKRSEQVPASMSKLNVVAHMAQNIVYKAKVPMENIVTNSGTIPLQNFPSGILQITVFTQDWQPLAERVVMVNNNDYIIDATLKTPVTGVTKRAKNVYEIEVNDTLLSNLSVAVTDGELGQIQGAGNIYSGLLLTGDVKGYVHNPAYYFLNTSDSIANNLDLVLLTHGWRRFKWNDVVQGKKPVIKYPDDTYLSINAKVLTATPYNPLLNGEELMLIIHGKDSSNNIMQLPKTGYNTFSRSNLIFYDTAKVYYQFLKDRKVGSTAVLQFQNGLPQLPPVVIPWRLPVTLLPADTAQERRNNLFDDLVAKFGGNFTKDAHVLQDVIVRTRKKTRIEELDEKYASSFFTSDNGYSFDFTDPTKNPSTDIFTFLQGRVPGLTITPGSTPTISWRGSTTATFLNQMQVDPQTLSTVSVSEIAYIKVFRPPFIGALGSGGGGAIAVYTRKGGDVQVTPGAGLESAMLTGYSASRQFYSPDYSQENSDDVQGDFRTTLYWNPFVFTDTSRKTVKFEFYNNDISKSIRVIIEGVNEFGKLIRIEKVIK